MIAGIVDTTVIIHLIRSRPEALAWLAGLHDPLGLTPITWIEIMRGENSKRRQTDAKTILSLFELVYLEHVDQQWVMNAVERDSGNHMNDCMIAAVAYRLNVPVYTHNLVDMQQVLPRWKVIRPYPIE